MLEQSFAQVLVKGKIHESKFCALVLRFGQNVLSPHPRVKLPKRTTDYDSYV